MDIQVARSPAENGSKATNIRKNRLSQTTAPSADQVKREMVKEGEASRNEKGGDIR
jgi:hypothetical protein